MTQDRGIDLLAFGPGGDIVLVGQVKSRLGTSEAWARGFRRNMLAHGTIPRAPFFLIATPERLYLWKQDQPDQNDRPPEFTLDTRKEFQHYLGNSTRIFQSMGDGALELIVSSWLTEVAGRNPQQVKNDPSTRWLSDSGLLRTLEEARFEMNPA